MLRDFLDPTPEQQHVLLIDAATLQKAQRMITGCQACSEHAEIPFDNILDSWVARRLRENLPRRYGNFGLSR